MATTTSTKAPAEVVGLPVSIHTADGLLSAPIHPEDEVDDFDDLDMGDEDECPKCLDPSCYRSGRHVR